MKYLTCKIESNYSDLGLPLASDRIPIVHFNRVNGKLAAEIAGYATNAGTVQVIERRFTIEELSSNTSHIRFQREFEILLGDKFCTPKGNGEWKLPTLSYNTSHPTENAQIDYLLFGEGYTQGTMPATEITPQIKTITVKTSDYAPNDDKSTTNHCPALCNSAYWEWFGKNSLAVHINKRTDNDWYADLCSIYRGYEVYIKGDGILVGAGGNGRTPEEAFQNMLRRYSGETLRILSWEGKEYKPIDIQFPIILINTEGEN